MLLKLGNLGLRSNVKSGFSPADIANLQLWLDAGDETTITDIAGVVSQWDDKSGNNNHAVQVDTTKRPITNSVNINSNNAIDFDGVNDFMSFPAISRASGYTAFVVSRLDNMGSSPKTLISGVQGSFDLRYDNAPIEFQIVRTNESVILGSTSTPLINTNYLISARSDVAGNNIQVNGVTDASNSIDPNYSADITEIGSQFNGTQFFFNGRIGEILVYTGTLSSAEMNLVGNYLSNKWGIAWANI